MFDKHSSINTWQKDRMSKENLSEKLFIDWCLKHQFQCLRISTNHTKTPDFKVTKSDITLYAEVKEIIANEEEKRALEQLKTKGWSGAFGEEPGKTVREKIKDAYPQLKHYSVTNKVPGVLVLYNNTGMIGNGRIDAYNVLIGMFGTQTIPVYVSNNPETPPIIGKDYFGRNKSVWAERKTYLSAIIVLYTNIENTLCSSIYHNPFAKHKIPPEFLNLSDSFQFSVNLENLIWENIKL